MPIERIEVTGSLISRIPGESSLPVTTLTAADIAKTGVTSVTDLIQQLPQMQGFVPSSSSINGGGGGITTAALHSLPSKYTLVLLDGKRVAPFGLGSVQGFGFGVNLESIPLDAIDRVEILTDGASALYGSDAVGGVVNFITKKNSTQGSAYFNDNITQHPGAGGWSAGISKGFGDLNSDGYNVLATYAHDYTAKLLASQRDFSAQGAYFPFNFRGVNYIFNNRTSNTEPANISFQAYPTGGPANSSTIKSYSINPYYVQHGTCGTPFAGVLTDPAALGAIGEGCRFNYAAVVEDLPRTQRDTGLIKGAFKLNDKTTLWAELALSDIQLTSQYAPPAQPFGINTTNRVPTLYDNYVVPYLNANGLTIYSKGSSLATVGYRAVAAGGRADDYDTSAQHLSFGADGSAYGFDYKTSLTLSHGVLKDKAAGGYLDYNGFSSLIAAGIYDPVAGTGGASLQPFILKNTFETTTSDTDTFSAQAQHDVFKLPGGMSTVAFGGEYIYTRYRNAYDPLILSSSGFSTQPPACAVGPCDYPVGGNYGQVPFDASRDNWGLFGEWDFPIVRSFEVDTALRYDSYSQVQSKYVFSTTKDANGVFDQLPNANLGNTFSKVTGKVSFRYTPIDQVLVRGAYGTGFRAPALTDVAGALTFNGNTAGTYVCPFPGSAGCIPGSAQYDLLLGPNGRSGSTGLQEEKSKQWTVGFRVEPIHSVSLGADFWDVRITNQIISQGIPEQLAFNNPQKYSQFFINPYQDPAGFPTIALEQIPFNGGVADYQGVDWDFSYKTATPIGKLFTDWSGTYMLKQRYNFAPGLPYFTDLGVYGPDSAVVFRVQFNLTASLQSGPFLNTLVAHFKSGYTDEHYAAGNSVFLANPNGSLGPSVAFPGLSVSDFATFDWQLRYTPTKAWEVTGGIINLFDKSPPRSLQSGGGGNEVGYDGRYYDPSLRTFYGRIKYNF